MVEQVQADQGQSEVAPPSSTNLQSVISNLQSFRAWCYLVWFSWQRQARAHLMVWISLGLLAFLTFVVALNTQAERWSVSYWRSPPRVGPSNKEWLGTFRDLQNGLPWDPSSAALRQAVNGAYQGVLLQSGFF